MRRLAAAAVLLAALAGGAHAEPRWLKTLRRASMVALCASMAADAATTQAGSDRFTEATPWLRGSDGHPATARVWAVKVSIPLAAVIAQERLTPKNVQNDWLWTAFNAGVAVPTARAAVHNWRLQRGR